MIKSIRARLMLGLMLALSAASTLVISASWYGASRELASLFDAHLQQSAAIMMLWAQTEPRAGETLNADQFGSELQRLLPLMQGVHLRRQEREPAVADRRELAYAIVCDPAETASDRRECLSVASPNAPALLRGDAPFGFSEQREGDASGDTLWHVYTLRDRERRFTVRVAERDDVRRQIITNIVIRQSGVSLLLIPLTGILVWFVIGQGLRPLRQLSEEINARRGDLLEPVANETPEEVSVLVDALNQLFIKVAQALDRERRFSADVAHELRTPLSVIKTTAELASSKSLAGEEPKVYAGIVRQCERAARVLDQLLDLARMDADQIGQRLLPVDLPALARGVMADLAAQADVQGVELVLDTRGDDRRIIAEPVSLSILLRNLLDNAIRHSPRGAEVFVAVTSSVEATRLSVRDQGPGLSDAQRQRLESLLKSGDMRLAPADLNTDQSGYGLGLVMVQRIAMLHGATIELRSADARGRGLNVVVTFADTAVPQN